MDVKTLQLRWTDIEIRKYRLADTFAPKPNSSVIDDEDLPPLEDKPKDNQIDSGSRISQLRGASQKTSDSSRHFLTPTDEKEMEEATVTPNMRTNFFDYRDESSSDDDEKKPSVTHYNDLEELD